MIMVLPAVLDLRTNGETLSEITTFKTEATAFLDIIMKNMIGVYDTTKYGSIPFIYIGLLPLIFRYERSSIEKQTTFWQFVCPIDC